MFNRENRVNKHFPFQKVENEGLKFFLNGQKSPCIRYMQFISRMKLTENFTHEVPRVMLMIIIQSIMYIHSAILYLLCKDHFIVSRIMAAC